MRLLMHAGAVDGYAMQGTRGPGRRGFALDTAKSGGPAADVQSGAGTGSSNGGFWGNYVTQVVSGQAGGQQQSSDGAAGSRVKPHRAEGAAGSQKQRQSADAPESAQQPIQQQAPAQQPKRKERLKGKEVAAARSKPEQQPARQRKEPAVKALPATKAEYTAAFSAAGSAAAAALRGLAELPSTATAKAGQQPSHPQRDTNSYGRRRSSEPPRAHQEPVQGAAPDAGLKRSSGEEVKGTRGLLGRALKDAGSKSGPAAVGKGPPGLAAGFAQAAPGPTADTAQPADQKAAANRSQRRSTADEAQTATSVEHGTDTKGPNGGSLPQHRASRRGEPRSAAGDRSPHGGGADATAGNAVVDQVAAVAAGEGDGGGSPLASGEVPQGTQLSRSQQKRASKKRQKERKAVEQQAYSSGPTTSGEPANEAQQPPESSSPPGTLAASSDTADGQVQTVKTGARKAPAQQQPTATDAGVAPSSPAKPQQANAAPKQRKAEQVAAPATAEEPEGGRSGVMARLAAFMGPTRGLFSKASRNVPVCTCSCQVQSYHCQSCCMCWHSLPQSSAFMRIFLGRNLTCRLVYMQSLPRAETKAEVSGSAPPAQGSAEGDAAAASITVMTDSADKAQDAADMPAVADGAKRADATTAPDSSEEELGNVDMPAATDGTKHADAADSAGTSAGTGEISAASAPASEVGQVTAKLLHLQMGPTEDGMAVRIQLLTTDDNT